jgi:hypothetical protein
MLLTLLFLCLGTNSALASVSEQINSLPVLDALNRSESPLSNGGKWSALNWATNSSGHATGQDTTAGWGPYDAFVSGSNGAYWNPSTFSDASGSAAAITMQAYPEIAERFVSIWLDMPSPGSARSGYELRWTLNSNLTTYTVKLSKWSSGTQTVLASNSEVSIPNGTTMAISDTGGTVTAWKGSGGTLTSVLSATDSTYSSGYAGIEAAGNFSRSQNFKAGSLGLLAPPDTTISGGPSGVVVPNLSFSFTASPSGGASFECSLDGASYASCTSPKSYQGLAEGSHAFRVRATNAAGVDQTPAERSFQVVPAAKAVTKVLGLDNFERQEVPLATGKWSKLSWSSGIGGAWCCSAYRGYGSNGGLEGAYWNPTNFSDGGAETVLVSGKVGTGAPIANEYLALWLDMPSPGAVRSGYEARFTGVNGSATNYKVELSKWASGTRTVLASTSGFSLPVGTTMALTETSGGSLALWTGTSSLSPLLTANDSTYSSGYAGLEVNGLEGTIYDFRAGRIDIQPPDTTIQSGPSGVVSPQNVSFTFTATEAGSSFECSIDSGAYGACSSPKSYPSLATGPHTFRVRAVDAVGNQDGTPAQRSFEVAKPPTGTTGTATAVGTREAILQGSVNPNGVATTYQFEYGTTTAYGKTIPATPKSVGSGSQAVAVEEPVAGLEPGTTYHFRIAANNAGGTSYGQDQSFLTLADTELPETTITEGAYSTTAQTATSFLLESDESGTTFECRLDGGAWQGCSVHPGYANLAAGPHHFEARAVGEEGVVDPTPAQRDWVVDPNGPLAKPKVEGTPRIGRTLSVSKGSWGGSGPTSYSYQWYRCQSSDPAKFGSCQAVPGATSAQYQVTQADQGQHLVAQVTANRGGGQGLAAQTTTETQTTTLSRFSLPALIETIRSALSERMVFFGCEDVPNEDPSALPCGLWITNAAGANPILILRETVDPKLEVLHQYVSPALSRDGSLIVYIDQVTNCLMAIPAQPNGSPREVECPETEEAEAFRDPDFTPDGQIVYVDRHDHRVWQIDVDGTGKEPLFTWPNSPDITGPVVSPDGTHLAFSSTKGPNGQAQEGVWVTTMSGTEPRFIQSERSGLDWSPDGGKLVLLFHEPGTFVDFVGIYNLASGTRTKPGPSNIGGPTWSADGKWIAGTRLTAGDEIQLVLIDPVTGTEHRILESWLGSNQILHLSFRLAANPEATTPDDLLERYKPVVYYHPEENYFADSADEAIEWHENLVYQAIPSLVAADHEGGSNEVLNPEWFRNRIFSEGDVLNEQGDNQEAADWGHVQPAMANHVYADEITSADGKVEWLQYWFFYYYNDSLNGAGFSTYGTHEGDWEFVEYAYDPETEQITQATYDQHDGAKTCPSSALHYVVTADGRVAPAVYSAKSSHASYYHPGDYDLHKGGVLDLGNDHVSGEAGPTELTMSRLNEEPWFAWEGHWGGTFPMTYFLVGTRGETSPTGPGLGDNEKEMVDPDRVAEEGEGDCSPE